MEEKKIKKLSLNKKKIANLSKDEMDSLLGGAAAASTNHNFTCGLCTTSPGSVSVYTSAVSVNPRTTSDRCGGGPTTA